jgi:serine/threonine protein kinase
MDDDEVVAAFPEFNLTVPPAGKGGAKIAYRATDGSTEFALKVTMAPLDLDDDEEREQAEGVIERFEREMRAMQAVACPHVATVSHGPSTRLIGASNHLWFGEPFLNDGTLYNVLRTGTLTPDAADELGRALLTAVVAMWNAEGIVHRDIKPQNIGYIDGQVVLMDLGTVLFTELTPLTAPSLTGPGSQFYASPEQFEVRRFSTPDFRSDLFQIGIVLFEAVAGRHPFRGTKGDYLDALKSFDASRLSGLSCSDRMKALVARLLQSRPAGRFRTPEDALSFLEEGS